MSAPRPPFRLPPSLVANYDQNLRLMQEVVDKLVREQAEHDPGACACGSTPEFCLSGAAIRLLTGMDRDQSQILLTLTINRLAEHEKNKK